MVKEYQINSDTQLWNDFTKGNQDAFRVIYSNHVHSLYKFGCHFTNDEELVKDCIHDLFVDLAKYRFRLGATNNIKLYLYKSLKRKIIKSLDKRSNFESFDKEDIPFTYLNSAEEEIVDEESEKLRYKQLNGAIEALSPRQKEAIYLKIVSGLSYEELARVMHVNYQSARNLVFRGLEKLRETFPRTMVLFILFRNRQ